MTQPLLNRSCPPDTPSTMPADTKAPHVDEFIYLISHDVRSSVRALLELPQWIAEDLEEAGFEMKGAVAESIEMMNRHTKRLDRMLIDLLTYSRVGRLQRICDIDLNAALDQVLEAVALPPQFKIVRQLTCQSILFGDRDMQTLLTALIDNAAKHHDRPDGCITVSSHRDAGEVVLTVTDDGPGIAPEFHERVFQPMTTLQSRDDVEGTGLGLSTVRKIASLYQGSVRLQPAPRGQGTSVAIRVFPALLSELD